MPIVYLYVLFGEMSVQVLCPFFEWVICFDEASWAVSKFWRLIPYWSHHLQIFFPVCGLSFHFVYCFLCYAKAFKLIRFVYFCFFPIILGDGWKVDHFHTFFPYWCRGREKSYEVTNTQQIQERWVLRLQVVTGSQALSHFSWGLRRFLFFCVTVCTAVGGTEKQPP